MRKIIFISIWMIGLFVFLISPQNVLAHESIEAGDYEIEIGWLDEPPIAGQKNAIVVNVVDTSSGTEQPVEDVSSLTVTVSYGGQSKLLRLEPLAPNAPGKFVAPILPTLAGEYKLTFGGKLGDTEVNAEGYPEEVEAADTLEFPSTQAGNNWLVWASFLIALLGMGFGVTALLKRR